MRGITIGLALVLASSVVHADELGLHGDVEAGLVIGGARIHDAGGMLAGLTLAAGASWHRFSLLGTYEHDDFIPNDSDPSVKVDRLGWRARYDQPLMDDVLGRDGWRSKWTWYFDAGTGEQQIHWDGSNSSRADIEVGTGFSLLVYDPHQKLFGPPWGLSFGFEMTSAAALPAIATPTDIARETDTTTMAPSTAGRENAYLFTFACRFL
jgi:hypothetical protein